MSDRTLRSSRRKQGVKCSSSGEVKSEERKKKKLKSETESDASPCPQYATTISSPDQAKCSKDTSLDTTKFHLKNTCTIFLEHHKGVEGVTILDEKIYLVRSGMSQVDVLNSISLVLQPSITIPDMRDPVSLAGCSSNKILYISDQKRRCIHRVNLLDHTFKKWKVQKGYQPFGLSAIEDKTVLVTIRSTQNGLWSKGKAVEYNHEGNLLRDIEFDKDHRWALHTAQIHNDEFIICNRHIGSPHRLHVVNSEGQIVRMHSAEENEDKKFTEPCSLTVDHKRGLVFVADWGSRMIAIVSKDLNVIGHIQGIEVLWDPLSLHYDSVNDQLLVGDFSGRLHVISVMD